MMIFGSYFRTNNSNYLYHYFAIALFSTLYSYAWDIFMDWGLMRGTTPETRLLRDKLKFPKHYYYFVMITNLLLRFSWVLTLVPQ